MSSVQYTPPAVDASRNTPITKTTDHLDWQRTVALECSTNVNGLTLEGMFHTLMQQFIETRKLIETVRSEMSDINKKIDCVKTELLSDITFVKDECTARFQHHDTALDLLNSRVDNVSQKIGALHNRNELIISGIPYRKGENLHSTLKTICRHLAVDDATTRMAQTKRMKGRKSDSDSPIVVEFALKATRDAFYSAYLRNRDLNLKHIGLDCHRRVYINESLTIEARKLKSAALQRKKAGKLSSVFTKEGVVHVRAGAGGQPIAIKSKIDLDKYS